MARMACIAILLLASSLFSSHAIRVPRPIRCPYNSPHFDEPFRGPCRPWGPGTNRFRLPEAMLENSASAPPPFDETKSSRFGSSKRMLWWPWDSINQPDPVFDEPYNPPVKGSSVSARAPSDETESSRFGSSKRMLWWPWDSINRPGPFPPVKGSSTSAPAPSDETESSRFGSSKRMLWWPWDSINRPSPFPPVKGSSASAPSPSDEIDSSRFGSRVVNGDHLWPDPLFDEPFLRRESRINGWPWPDPKP